MTPEQTERLKKICGRLTEIWVELDKLGRELSIARESGQADDVRSVMAYVSAAEHTTCLAVAAGEKKGKTNG